MNSDKDWFYLVDFHAIEEDELTYRLLCSEYPAASEPVGADVFQGR